MICLIVAFADLHEHSWVTRGGGWGDATAMARPEVLGSKFRKRERDIGWVL